MSEQAVAELRPVERLEVRILVDNAHDDLSSNPEHVQNGIPGLIAAGMRELSGEAICCANWGYSLLITAHVNGSQHTLLLDGGPEAYALERNAERLGVDFAAVEAIMLTHGHMDHSGGLLRATELIRAARAEGELPCYLHPGMFRKRGMKLPNGEVLPFADVPPPDAFRQAGATPVVTDQPCTLLDGCFFVSGEIPRVTPYEQGMPPHVRHTEDGSGWEPDPLIMDERFLAVLVEDKGLIVFSGCSHAGIVNVLTEARRRFPAVPLHAVMGGLHLAGAAVEPIIPDTVRDLAGFDLRWIVPCHCTGWRAVTALVNAFGEERVAPGAVGKRFMF